MAKYRIRWVEDDELEDDVFDTYEEADDYGLYLQGCARTGAETLHWSNPGDYEYDADTFEAPEYEIIEEDD